MSAALNMTQDKQRRACSLLQAGLLGFAILAAANSVASDTREAVRSFFCQGMGDRSFASEAPLAIQKAARSVWKISSPRASGSGFFLSPRLLVTNFHVVEAFEKDFPEGIDLIQNGEPSGMRIKWLISASAIEDVAVLETDRDAPFYLNLREKPLSANEDAFILGYPGGAFRFLRKTGPLMNFGGFMQFPLNFTKKMVGLSGGPAVDSGGSVSGIFHKGSGNFSLFTKSNHLKGVLEEEPPPGATRCSPTAPAKECLDEAKRLAFEKAAEGDALAQYSVGHRSLMEKDFDAAVHWLDRAAEQGYAPAQDSLGSMYLYGNGVEQDFETAAYWIIKAAEQGHVPAQDRLAFMYLRGEGVELDFETAALWTAKAAEQGHVLAQNRLASMYQYGLGVKQDLEKAADWFAKAAEQSDAKAQSNLGLMYLYGDGVEKSLEKAVLWMMRAAEQDYAPALSSLFVETGLLSAALRGEKLCAQP